MINYSWIWDLIEEKWFSQSQQVLGVRREKRKAEDGRGAEGESIWNWLCGGEDLVGVGEWSECGQNAVYEISANKKN